MVVHQIAQAFAGAFEMDHARGHVFGEEGIHSLVVLVELDVAVLVVEIQHGIEGMVVCGHCRVFRSVGD